ncbi:MAG: XdhC/CoxI family protein [Novosphingobium sp.]
MDVFEELVRERTARRGCALATIVKAHGSIPASDRAKMLVKADGSIIGTVGVGAAEGKVIAAALEALKTGRPELVSFNLHDNPLLDNGMVCGGTLEIYIEPFRPAASAYLFGGGHVGLVTARLAHLVGFEFEVIDDRPEFANAERFPEARATHAGPWEETTAKLAPDAQSLIFIATRGHAFDAEVLAWALTTPASYIGMIGSSRKCRTVYSKLRATGVTDEQLARVNAPVGLNIAADTPEEIAVSVVAEMIAHVRGATNVNSRSMADLAPPPEPAAHAASGGVTPVRRVNRPGKV